MGNRAGERRVAWGTYPGGDAGVALELLHHAGQLRVELCLVFGRDGHAAVGAGGSLWVHKRGHGRHVLDDHQPQLVTGAVEQAWLDFDLFVPG